MQHAIMSQGCLHAFEAFDTDSCCTMSPYVTATVEWANGASQMVARMEETRRISSHTIITCTRTLDLALPVLPPPCTHRRLAKRRRTCRPSAPTCAASLQDERAAASRGQSIRSWSRAGALEGHGSSCRQPRAAGCSRCAPGPVVQRVTIHLGDGPLRSPPGRQSMARRRRPPPAAAAQPAYLFGL